MNPKTHKSMFWLKPLILKLKFRHAYLLEQLYTTYERLPMFYKKVALAGIPSRVFINSISKHIDILNLFEWVYCGLLLCQEASVNLNKIVRASVKYSYDKTLQKCDGVCLSIYRQIQYYKDNLTDIFAKKLPVVTE